MKVLWAILCESSVTDKDTNNVSLFNIIEEVTIQGPTPAVESEPGSDSIVVPLGLNFVILWSRSNLEVPEKGQGRVRLLDPDGEVAPSREFEVDLTEFLRMRVGSRLPGLPSGKEGEHLFRVEGKVPDSDWKQMFELPLRVIVRSQDPD